MNKDIRLLLSFRNHPKTKKLRLKLGDSGPLGFIYLLMFTAESKPDGVLDGMDAEDIALASDYRGDTGEYVGTLVAVRLLDFDGEIYSVHDWEENNPWAAGAEERSEKARHAARVRHSKKDGASTKNQQVTPKNDATSTDKQCDEQEPALQGAPISNAPSPSPSPSPSKRAEAAQPEKTAPRKRGCRLPENWKPSEETQAWAMTERKDLDLQRVLDSFTDYWRAKTGSAATKLDWDATFRNWVRNEKSSGTGRNRTGETAVQRSERLEREAFAKHGITY